MSLPPPAWESAFLSDRGAVRKVNEDSFFDAPDLGVWAVADGMGGHEAGQMASATVVHALEDMTCARSLDVAEQQVCRRIAAANDTLQALSRRAYGGKTIGSTVAILILQADRACCLWAGDSRVYRLRGGRLERLTRDHSRMEEFIARREITPAEAENHPEANVITRAVGATASVELDRRCEPFDQADTFLVCSDGLYRSVEESEIAAALHQANCKQAAEALLALSLGRKPADNVTLGVVRMGGDATIVAAATPRKA